MFILLLYMIFHVHVPNPTPKKFPKPYSNLSFSFSPYFLSSTSLFLLLLFLLFWREGEYNLKGPRAYYLLLLNISIFLFNFAISFALNKQMGVFT